MTGLTELRARVLLEEARALGVGLADLQAAADHHRSATFAEVIDAMVPAFTPATAARYRPYWRLAVELRGDQPIRSLTVCHLQEIVDQAASRAQQRRPGTAGRASRETTVAALRAVFRRAAASGLVAANCGVPRGQPGLRPRPALQGQAGPGFARRNGTRRAAVGARSSE